MRRIALINQKGGVGKTTTTANLGAALARAGRRVVLIDLDPQANLSLHLDCAVEDGAASTYTLLTGVHGFAECLRETSTPRMRLCPASLDLSGAELELANAFGREMLLREAIDRWAEEASEGGVEPADYLLIDCPPSLGLLSVNGLVAAREAFVAVQTEFFALQGMSKLVEIVHLLRRRLNPTLEVSGILPCLYDSRLKLAREVLAEIRKYFPGKVLRRPIAKNVKLAEAPSYGRTIFEYAPDSPGAADYEAVAAEVLAQEHERDPELAARPLEASAAPARAAAPPKSSDARRAASKPVEEATGEPTPDPEPAAEVEPRPAPTRRPRTAPRAHVAGDVGLD
ncbi:MAG TPA: ParA family protein [Planctomycetota bacterium]|nr:ParA family protein [Planctomycetota bacterium]